MSSKAGTWHRKYFHTDYHIHKPHNNHNNNNNGNSNNNNNNINVYINSRYWLDPIPLKVISTCVYVSVRNGTYEKVNCDSSRANVWYVWCFWCLGFLCLALSLFLNRIRARWAFLPYHIIHYMLLVALICVSMYYKWWSKKEICKTWSSVVEKS